MAAQDLAPILQGTTQPLTITVTQGATTTPQDITGAAITFLAKYSLADADAQAVITKTVGSGITISNPTGGVFSVSLLPADTAPTALLPALVGNTTDTAGLITLQYAAKVTLSGGTEAVVAYGKLPIQTTAVLAT